MEKYELGPDSLNEIATLLHITSEIATNHPKLGGIARACQRKLDEINLDLVQAEGEAAEAKKKAEAERQAAEYKAPKPGDPNYVEPEKLPPPKGGSDLLDAPVETLPDNSDVTVERRV